MGDYRNVWEPGESVWCGSLYEAETMTDAIREYAVSQGWEETPRALDFALRLHQGQYRKQYRVGGRRTPYIVHPLTMVCHAWALGWREDTMTAAILLHDVCEDCGVTAEELPVSDDVRYIVSLLTKNPEVRVSEAAEAEYYRKICEDRTALLIKLLDRCNNAAGMAAGFAPSKLQDYIVRTERDFYPMLALAEQRWAELAPAIFLLRYHMYSIVESLKALTDVSYDGV